MRNRLKELMPHAVILICNMYVVFFLIDRVNPAMNFIDNRLTKGLLALLCAAAVYDAMTLARLERRGRRRPAGQRPRPEASRGAARPASRSAARPANRSADRAAGRPAAAQRRGDRR